MINKGIFLDLDGTLLNDQDKISKADLDFLLSIKDEYNLYISTGKSLSTVLPIYNQLELNTWLTTSQGTVLSKPNEDIFKTNYIPLDIINEVKEMNISNIVYDMDQTYCQIGDIGIDISRGKISQSEPSDKVLGIYTTEAIDVDLDSYSWDMGNGKVFIYRPRNINKETAMNQIIKLDSLKETIFAGNGRADINSMKQADQSIAMSNAYDEVKEAATHISKYDNNASGVSEALKTILKK